MHLLLWLRCKSFDGFVRPNSISNLFNQIASDAPVDRLNYSESVEDLTTNCYLLLCHVTVAPDSVKQYTKDDI